MTKHRLSLVAAARAEALFASDLPRTPAPEAELDAVIRAAVHHFGGTRGCAAHLAAEYGDHPETAVPRMRWAVSTVLDAYSRPIPTL